MEKKPRYKVGDRVACIESVSYWTIYLKFVDLCNQTGTITWANPRFVWVQFDNLERCSLFVESILLESTFNSPVYQLLKDENDNEA